MTEYMTYLTVKFNSRFKEESTSARAELPPEKHTVSHENLIQTKNGLIKNGLEKPTSQNSNGTFSFEYPLTCLQKSVNSIPAPSFLDS